LAAALSFKLDKSKHDKRSHREKQHYCFYRKLFDIYVQYEKNCNYYHEYLEDIRENMHGDIVPAEIKQRKNHRYGGYGQALIFLARLGADSLPLFLGYVEIAKTYYRRLHDEIRRNKTQALVKAVAVADYGRENPETDKVAERVYLNAENLFLGGSVFHRARNFSVEHIAYARNQQAEVNYVVIALENLRYAEYRGRKPQICKYYRSIKSLSSEKLLKSDTARLSL
jgi:hypothetical protein